MPIFLLLVLLEKLYGVWRGKDTYNSMDMVSSLSSGVTNVTKDVMQLTFSILSYEILLHHVAIYQIQATWLTFLVTFIVMDFQGYWIHRMSHQINFFWNKHAIHHSSEDFNLACALRQSISSFVNLFTFFLLPAAILGVSPKIIAIVGPVHLFAQFWYHTQHIGKMGFLEHLIVTPSHHRVHHAINPEYLDKNHAQIFIIWDKLFGTFQAELPDVPAVYGITRPAQTWNPIKINFQHLLLLIQDAWQTQYLKDKFTIWFKPTGWRPADVEAQYPVAKIDDVYDFQKYNPHNSNAQKTWVWLQMLATFALVMYFFANLGTIQRVNDLWHFFTTPNILLYGLFIILSVYAYTELMDNSPQAYVWELIRSALGCSILYVQRDWFGISSISPMLNFIILAFFALSLIVSVLFCITFVKNNALINAKM